MIFPGQELRPQDIQLLDQPIMFFVFSNFISDQECQNKMSYQANYNLVSRIDSFQTRDNRLSWNVPKSIVANRDITNPDSQGRSWGCLTNIGDPAKYKLELDWKLCECSTKQIDFEK